jgi:signal transduction histidine kinase
MTRHFPIQISLRTKFIIFIGAIISAFYLFMLYRTAVFDEKMILKQAEQQARMLHKQILLTRQWASDHNGLFIMQRKGIEPNPFLELPVVTDSLGHSYYMRNPAMITRELSVYAQRDGLGYFRVTSLKPVNPANAPDVFEKIALEAFDAGTAEVIDVDKSAMGRVVRFIAPLVVTESCLGCHARHGYGVGDIRGGLSITIPIDWAHDLINKNMKALLFIGVMSILIVTIALFLMFESLIVHRIKNLSLAMERFPDESPAHYLLPSRFKDEIDTVSANFVLFCNRLTKSQEELLATKAQAHLGEKMASLGILTSGIAHEINNPLGGMLNCVKSMRENPGDLELNERYLPLLDKGLRQIETIMRQLLNFGRMEPLHLRKVNLRSLLDECTMLLSYKLKNIDFINRIEVDGEHLLDAEALKQIIINIGLNAIQAMPDGGKLTIACTMEAGVLTLVFQDTGMGIAEENLPHIFDPFFTTKGVGEGTGLGLAVTYSLVQRMNGTITVAATLGQGTVFTITIPVAPNQTQPMERAEN